MKVFTWHIHGTYLYYLTQTPVEFYLPVTGDNSPGYGGRAGTFPWGRHVHEIHVDDVKRQDFDVILFQSDENYTRDQFELFTESQRNNSALIYLEHDPPQKHPTNTKHIVADKRVLIVHVTHFNNLMWDNNGCRTKVIEHGVKIDPEAIYTGEKEKGIVVINNISKRGRRLGFDIYQKIQQEIPLELVGLNSQDVDGGLGEIPPHKISTFIGQYRFFFNPIRYTSLGLALCEAMTVGMPIIGLATTEMVTAVQNNYNGYVDTDVNRIILQMHKLLEDHKLAKEWGRNAAIQAHTKWNITRFTNEWLETFKEVTN